MSLPSSPPASTAYTLRRGSEGWAVYALQGGLNTLKPPVLLVADGDFGPATEKAVRAFQQYAGLTVDGIAGPATQVALSRLVLNTADTAVTNVPQGLLRGLVTLESGGLLGAVNWRVAGGVDCGLVQRRVYGPPFTLSALSSAFGPLRAATDALQEFKTRRDSYFGLGWVGESAERAGRCAALAHNWPAGALGQAKNGHVSSPDALATWVPEGVRFPDGAPVRTRQEWAQFYALGGPHGEGQASRFVTKW